MVQSLHRLAYAASAWETAKTPATSKKDKESYIPIHEGGGMQLRTAYKKSRVLMTKTKNSSLPQMYPQAPGIPPRDPLRQLYLLGAAHHANTGQK